MNTASQWRHDIAARLGALYAANPKVAAVMLGGSSGRGHSDQFSDMDVGVFWREAPTDAERLGVIEAAGADLKRLYDYDPSECVWSDDYFMGRNTAGQPGSGLYVEVANYTADFMETTLNIVLGTYSTDELAHGLISGVVNGMPLYGATLLRAFAKSDWQKRDNRNKVELTRNDLKRSLSR